MAVGLFAIPRLIHAIGTDKFGVLMIAWIVVGYFSFFDLGLGRAVTNLVSQKLATDNNHELPAIIWTSNLVMGVMGILGGIILALLSRVIVLTMLKTPPTLQAETIKAFYMLSLAVPFVVSTAGFRAILEARQRFRIISLIRIPMGVATFAAPLLVLPWSKSLVAMVGILVVARFVFWLSYAFYALRDMPFLMNRVVIDMRLLPMLFSFGAWMTVSNIISPIMSYLDRFLIGMLLSLTAVTYYATSSEVASKMGIFPSAIVGVLFPAFSTALVADRKHAGMLFRRAVKYVTLALFPLTFLMVLFAQNGLSIWLGPNFARHSTIVLQILSIGAFTNSIASLPFAMVQGEGRADITGKLHLLELPFYVAIVWILTKHIGIEGTAIAWTIRTTGDCALLFWAVEKYVDKIPRPKSFIAGISTITVVLAVAMLNMSLPLKLLVSAIGMISYVAVAWYVLLGANERAFLLKRIGAAPRLYATL
jgi:O-antigen/teichoic acid export membrane protein